MEHCTGLFTVQYVPVPVVPTSEIKIKGFMALI